MKIAVIQLAIALPEDVFEKANKKKDFLKTMSFLLHYAASYYKKDAITDGKVSDEAIIIHRVVAEGMAFNSKQIAGCLNVSKFNDDRLNVFGNFNIYEGKMPMLR